MSIFTGRNGSGAGAGDKTQRLVWGAGAAVTAGMVGVSILMAYSGPAGVEPEIGAALTLFLIYTCAITAGTFIGFLFGLPRARVIDQVTSTETLEAAGKQKKAPLTTQFLTNSNLLKVSDWLTTIIIGLTLVNLSEIVPAVSGFGEWISAPLGGHPYSAAIGVFVAIGSALAGFLLGYLWTSIRVRELLEEAERNAGQLHLGEAATMTLDHTGSAAGSKRSNTVGRSEPRARR